MPPSLKTAPAFTASFLDNILWFVSNRLQNHHIKNCHILFKIFPFPPIIEKANYSFDLQAMKDMPILTNHVARLPSRMGVLRRALAHQASLPRLPIPALNVTLDKYLRFVQPLVSEEDFSHTKAVSCAPYFSVVLGVASSRCALPPQLVENFSRSHGPALQERLVARSKVKENWVSARCC